MNMVLVSSERAITYHLIGVLKILVMLYGSCWIVISIKYHVKTAISRVMYVQPIGLHADLVHFSGHMGRSCALFTC